MSYTCWARTSFPPAPSAPPATTQCAPQAPQKSILRRRQLYLLLFMFLSQSRMTYNFTMKCSMKICFVVTNNLFRIQTKSCSTSTSQTSLSVRSAPASRSGDGEVLVQRDQDVDFPQEEGAAEDNNLKPEYFSVYYIFVNLIFWIYKHSFTFHVSNSSP